MRNKRNLFPRLMAVFLVAVLLIGALPLGAMATDAETTPTETSGVCAEAEAVEDGSVDETPTEPMAYMWFETFGFKPHFLFCQKYDSNSGRK